MNGNKFATSQILEKPVEVVKGRILAGWAQKSPEPWERERERDNYIVYKIYLSFNLRKSPEIA
jgi:hypothetical protein